MRRGWLAGLIGILCAGALGVVPAAGAKGRCKLTRSKTVLSTKHMRVYRTRVVMSVGGVRHSTVFACWLASGRRTVVVREYRDPNLGEERLLSVRLAPNSQEVIGYEEENAGGTFDNQNVGSLDVRRGRTSEHTSDNVDTIGEFIFTTNGALAWIGSTSSRTFLSRCPSQHGVLSVDSSGTEQLLECQSGPGSPGGPPSAMSAALSQLTWSNGTLSWLSDGQPMSAPLN